MSDLTRWLGRLLLTVGVWFVICAVAAVFGSSPDYALLALVVFAVAGLVLLLLDTSARVEPAQWRLPDDEPVHPPGEDPRLALLTRAVSAHLDAHEVGPGLHDRLTEIADHRLLARHGVSRTADPDRAAALLGPELTAFAAATDPYPRLTIDQIDVLIDRIEDL